MLFQLSFFAIGRNVFAFVSDEQFSLITKINYNAEKTRAVKLKCVQEGVKIGGFGCKSKLIQSYGWDPELATKRFVSLNKVSKML